VLPLSDSPFPPVPLTLEGSTLLHQFFRFDWSRWRKTSQDDRDRIAYEALGCLQQLERASADAPVRSALFSQLGHKGDLILMHFRDSFEALNQVELWRKRNFPTISNQSTRMCRSLN
jgi:hydrogen peroxide-dependent heme synthase